MKQLLDRLAVPPSQQSKPPPAPVPIAWPPDYLPPPVPLVVKQSNVTPLLDRIVLVFFFLLCLFVAALGILFLREQARKESFKVSYPLDPKPLVTKTELPPVLALNASPIVPASTPVSPPGEKPTALPPVVQLPKVQEVPALGGLKVARNPALDNPPPPNVPDLRDLKVVRNPALDNPPPPPNVPAPAPSLEEINADFHYLKRKVSQIVRSHPKKFSPSALIYYGSFLPCMECSLRWNGPDSKEYNDNYRAGLRYGYKIPAEFPRPQPIVQVTHPQPTFRSKTLSDLIDQYP